MKWRLKTWGSSMETTKNVHHSAKEWIKKMWHIYNWILLSHKKGWNCAVCRDMDGLRDCHTEWSKSEKQILYINAYMWDLEKWYRWAHLQNRKKHIVENKHVKIKGRKGGGVDWEIGIDICSVCVLVTQLYPTLCDPMVCSPQTILSIEFLRQQYWLWFCSPGDLPDSGIKPGSPPLQTASSSSEPSGKLIYILLCIK